LIIKILDYIYDGSCFRNNRTVKVVYQEVFVVLNVKAAITKTCSTTKI